MRTSESIAKISAALAKALPEIQHATKDANNPAYHSTYATLNSVMDAVKPVLFEAGVVVIQGPGWRDGIVTLTTRFLHESGEWIETEAGAPVAHRWERVDGEVTDKGPDAQTAGSAISYLRRYSLAAMAGIGQEDDDGNAASGRRDSPRSEPKRQSSSSEITCPSCETESVWDNRAKKASGEFSPKSPDYACRDKDGCGWTLWIDTAREQLETAMEAMVVTNVITAEQMQRVMNGTSGGDLDDLRRAQDWVTAKQDEAKEAKVGAPI